MSNTKEIINQYLTTRPEKTQVKIRSMIDRPEVYEYEEKIGKSIFEMNQDELIEMIGTFSRRGAKKSKLSLRSYDVIYSLFRTLFDWYIENVAVIVNQFNNRAFHKKVLGLSSGRKDYVLSGEIIDKAIKNLYANETIEYAEYCEAIILMAREGFAVTGDIVNMKECDVNHSRRSVVIRGVEHLLSYRLYSLLTKIHSADSLSTFRGSFILIQFENSYFKFPTRQSFVDVKREPIYWQQYLSRLFIKKIAPCFEGNITYRDIYVFGLYEHIVNKYGKEKTDAMILSERDGETNRILNDEAIEYGIVAKSVTQTYIKMMLRDNMFPEG